LEWESRPFLVLPPAFLCAMTKVSCESVSAQPALMSVTFTSVNSCR
jgi:hypothetical protein